MNELTTTRTDQLDQQTNPSQHSDRSRTSILLISERKQEGQSLHTMIDKLGYHALGPFSPGRNALHQISEQELDLVLVDLTHRNGRLSMKTAEQISEQHGLPVIYIAPHIAFEIKDQRVRNKLQQSPWGFVTTPVQSTALQNTISLALERRKLLQQQKTLCTELKNQKMHRQGIVQYFLDSYIITDMEGFIQFASTSTLELLAYDHGELMGKHMLEIMEEDKDHPDLHLFSNQSVRNSTIPDGIQEVELHFQSANGTEIPILMNAFVLPDQQSIVVGATDMRSLEKARRDHLTGLMNRGRFIDRLNGEIERSVRHNYQFCLLMLDIDNLKHINDQLGHLSGDCVLQEIGEMVQQAIRASDFAGRYGGDELAIAVTETNIKKGQTVADRISKMVNSHQFSHNNNSFNASCSIGIGVFDGSNHKTADNQNMVDHLIQEADRALYLAKEQGTSHVEKRQHKRYPVDDLPVEIRFDNQRISGTIQNYSKNGLKILLPEKVESNQKIELFFTSSTNDYPMKYTGKIVWSCEAPSEQDGVLVGIHTDTPVKALTD